ncbi:MAG: OsmC family protein [Gelidibacter sp.]
MTSKVSYLGNLRTECTYLQSKSTFITDAPLDNNGKVKRSSPTDTVATGLASCMMTVMGIKAHGLGVDMKGTTASVNKIMATDPRRISRIEVTFDLPFEADGKTRKILERTANTCPVHYSLHPDIEKIIVFNWH